MGRRAGTVVYPYDGLCDEISITDARSLGVSPKYEIDFTQPCKPVENTFIEGVNGRLRDEGLTVHHFTFLDEEQTKDEAWRRGEK